jgi:DNA polymerase-1
MVSDRLEKVLDGKEGIILMDLSWMLHRNYHSFNWMSVDINGYKRPTGHIYGVLYTIETLRSKYPNYAVVLCQDGIPVGRQELSGSNDVGYKDGRAELAFDFYKDIPIIEAAAYLTPSVFWAYNEDKESDDLMYALAKQSERLFDGKNLIYSGDNDLLQAIDENISVVRKTGKDGSLIEITSETVSEAEEFVKKFYGVPPKKLPLFRSIIGDSSDNLKGIPRFPRRLAAVIVMSSNSFEDIFKFSPVTQTEKKYILLLNENRSLVTFNYQMMKLSDDFNVNLFRKRPDADKVIGSLKDLQMNRYLKSLGVI